MNRRLEESYDAALKENAQLITENQRLLSLNERYKEALAYIADRENCYEDLPAKAAKALEE